MSRQFDVVDANDNGPLSLFQYTVFAQCALVVFLDGFDTFAMIFVAPVVAPQFKIPPQTLGWVLSAHLFGMVIGSAGIGMLADRYGRRPAAIASSSIFALFAICTTAAGSAEAFLALRVATGIGLGGALTNVTALAAEYAPARIRATIVSIVYSAYPFGAVVGGPLAAWTISEYGWQSVFWIGGAAPAALTVLMCFALPESMLFQRRSATADRLLASTKRRPDTQTHDDFAIGKATRRRTVFEVFSFPYVLRTVQLWAMFFTNQLTVYFVASWMPFVLKASHLSLTLALYSTAALNLGGVFGGALLGRLVDVLGTRSVLGAAYLVAFAGVATIGVSSEQGAAVLIATVFVCGVFLNGANVCLGGVAAKYYPTFLRGTGIGWAMAVGRAGGIFGLIAGGYIIGAGLDARTLYVVAGLPTLLAALASFSIVTERDRVQALAE